jgi:hypothetical protein
MWAEHTKKPECYGVSLGVRFFVTIVNYTVKLTQLRNDESGQLEDEMKIFI